MRKIGGTKSYGRVELWSLMTIMVWGELKGTTLRGTGVQNKIDMPVMICSKINTILNSSPRSCDLWEQTHFDLSINLALATSTLFSSLLSTLWLIPLYFKHWLFSDSCDFLSARTINQAWTLLTISQSGILLVAVMQPLPRTTKHKFTNWFSNIMVEGAG